MKKLILSLTLLSLQVLAATTYVTGFGNYSAYCHKGASGIICMDQIKRETELRAEDDAQFRCDGRILSYTRSCSTSCYPAFFNGDRDELISCQSNCNFTCETR